MGTVLVWMFGRGASISCGLRWSVPQEWIDDSREEQIRKIKTKLGHEMHQPHVNTEPYRILLSVLSDRTNPGWKHLFVTTNWDTLLEKEIERLDLNEVPDWLSDTFVFHYNGSIEEPSNEFRTPFLLEQDPASQRNRSVEGNSAFNRMIWQRHFVVVGMSFNCPTDRSLLEELSSVGNDLPIGESSWIILNPNGDALAAVCKSIQSALPSATILAVQKRFDEWFQVGLPELIDWGVLTHGKR